jgi:hypothetical protein
LAVPDFDRNSEKGSKEKGRGNARLDNCSVALSIVELVEALVSSLINVRRPRRLVERRRRQRRIMKEVAQSILPGNAALFLLIRNLTTDKVLEV